MHNPPSIVTERLILRPHCIDDFVRSCEIWTNPDVTRFIGGTPSTEQQVWNRIVNYAGNWSLFGYGYWAVEERATARLIGDVGFANFHRDIEPAMQNVPEAGWVLHPEAHGCGYATEAVRAALLWVDANLESARTVCMVARANAASIRVAAKCGYRMFGSADFGNVPTLFFER